MTSQSDYCDTEETYRATNQAQSFHSIAYPASHPHNLDCVTKISADAGQVIEITFEQIHLESCCDYLQVRANFRFR